LIDHDQSFGRAHHLDDPGVRPLLKAQRGGSGRHNAYPGYAVAAPFDGGIAAQNAEPRDRVLGQGAPVQILDEHRRATQLGSRERLAEPDADLARGVSRRVKREHDGES